MLKEIWKPDFLRRDFPLHSTFTKLLYLLTIFELWMKKTRYICLFLFLITLFSGKLYAQIGDDVYNFLKLPYSARAGALGGANISIIENDPSLIFQNPGFLGSEMDMGLNVSYLMYIADVGAGSALFTKAAGERAAWGVGINFVNYGNIQETTDENVIIGDFSAQDICFNGFYAHDLTDRIRGGVTAKFIYSSYGDYTSIGLAADLGLTYYDADNDFSLGLTGKNLGGQISAYNDERASMPWEFQLGMTKRLAHAPIRFSITAVQLNKWKYYDSDGKKDSFGKAFIKHFVFGVDLTPSDNFWLSVGYNVKTGSDMSLTEGNKMGGFSGGAGIRIKSFEVGASVAKYHPSATSFMISLTNFFGQ